MVNTNGAAALLAFWVTLVPAIRGANTVDPTVKRRLRHRQGGVEHAATTRQFVAPDHRSKRLGAPATLSTSLKTRELQQEECVLQGNLYGNFDGNMRSVEFLYQGVFATGTLQTQVNLNILPDLEREIVSGILPAFFACPGSEPTGVIKGLSPGDADKLSTGGTYLTCFGVHIFIGNTCSSSHVQYWNDCSGMHKSS